MIETTNKEIDVEQLMAQIRQEVARRKQSFNQHSMSLPPSTGTKLDRNEVSAEIERAWTPMPEYRLQAEFKPNPEYRLQPKFKPNPERCYKLRELLHFHDRAFVENAYVAILQRPADGSGLQHFLNLLRQGESKITILGWLRYSAEGRHEGVKVLGLTSAFLLENLYRIPLVGRILRTFSVLLHLANLERNQRRFEAYAVQHLEIFNSQLTTAMAAVQEFFNTFNQQHQDQINLLLEHLRTDISAQLRLLYERKVDAAMVNDFIKTFNQQHYQETITQIQENLQNDVASQLRLLDERKVDITQLTSLTNHFTETVQIKADQAALAEVRNSLSQAVQAKADQAALAEVRNSLSQAVQAKADQAALAEVRNSLSQAVQAKADQTSLEKVEAKFQEQQLRIQAQKRSLLDQQRRLGLLLEEARKRLPAPLDNTQLNIFTNEADHLLNAMYATFEDRFRGDRVEIKQRMSVYLPIIEAIHVGSTDKPIVDIGCGRGEWLELLKERNLTARGVDMNRIMINECCERGFDVVEADALHYLRAIPDNSLGAVTGMHIIEHLSLPMLIALLDESLRVLRPGGLAIFETPNPENLVVGACNFYMDPTHRNPLPPAMVEYLVEARGFVRVEIRRWRQGLQDPLQFLPTEASGAAALNPLIQMAKDYYFAAPDYAVLGYKAGSN